MEREIKFRAWHESDGANGEMITMNSGIVSEQIKFWKSVYYDAIFMQYTGLKDKNGVEIYEGDILSFGRDHSYKVVWENGSFVLYHTKLENFDKGKLKWGLLSRAFDPDMKSFIESVEVIGNLYETPKLLTK